MQEGREGGADECEQRKKHMCVSIYQSLLIHVSIYEAYECSRVHLNRRCANLDLVNHRHHAYVRIREDEFKGEMDTFERSISVE